jgi:predicted aldo/keto reductase-like oxidoreductase
VHTLSCGAARPTDFDEHIAALRHYDEAGKIVAPIEKRLTAEIDRVLGVEWRKFWMDNLPEYEDVPGKVNVQEILRLWTYSKALDLVDWGKMRYNLLSGGGGHWFPGEMAKKVNDRNTVAALFGNRFAEKIPGILREAHRMLYDKPKKRLSQS